MPIAILLLPVTRKRGQETIGIAELAPVRLLAFRSQGPTAQSAADEQLTGWLIERGIAGHSDQSLYMAYSYGIGDDNDPWYELGISIPHEPDERRSWFASILDGFRARSGTIDNRRMLCTRHGKRVNRGFTIQSGGVGMGEYAMKRREAPGQKPQPGTESYKLAVIPKAANILFGGIAMNRLEQKQPDFSAESPIKNKLGSIFIPVRDIERSREWYCRLLGLPTDCPIMNGHLCPLPMDGTGLILDTMPMWGGKEPGGAPNIKTPAFMLLTGNLEAAYEFAKAQNVTLVTDIQHNHWFVIKDPDENLLMVCRE